MISLKQAATLAKKGKKAEDKLTSDNENELGIILFIIL